MDEYREFYCVPFLDFVSGTQDAHDCWQEDGFWPDRVEASLEHVLVWGTEIGLSYLNNGGMNAYLQFISGRTFPEMSRGFGVLKCFRSQQVCEKTIRRFGAAFPRSDAERAAVVESDPDYFEECGSELWDAMKADDYETIAEAYYKSVCDAHAIPPKRYEH